MVNAQARFYKGKGEERGSADNDEAWINRPRPSSTVVQVVTSLIYQTTTQPSHHLSSLPLDNKFEFQYKRAFKS